MKCAWPTITLASAGFAISTILSCIVLAPSDYCADDSRVDAAPEVSIRRWRRGEYRIDASREFRDAAAGVFLSALVARITNLSEERLRRAFRLRPQRGGAQLARSPVARARDRQSGSMHHLRSRVDRGNLPRPRDSARKRRDSRRASPQHSRRASWTVLSLRCAHPKAAVHRALDAHGAAPRRRQTEDFRAHPDA